MEQVWYKMGNVCANQCEGDVVLRSSGAFLGTSEQGCRSFCSLLSHGQTDPSAQPLVSDSTAVFKLF